MSLPFMLKKFLVRTGVARFLPVSRRLTDNGNDFVHYYSDRVLAAPVEELLSPATFPQLPGPDVLNLNEPAPCFDSPVSAGRVTADRTGLPSAWGMPELREQIAENLHRRDARKLDPRTDVLVTHGATGALASTLEAFVNPGDRVVMLDPCSPHFALGAKSRRARIRWLPTTTEDGRLRFSDTAMSAALRGAKLLVLADPGNPTGGTIAPEELERLAWCANRSDVLIFLDESYSKFRYDGRPCELATLPGAERRTLSAGSLTTEAGLGSLRLGWLAGPRHLVRACTLTQSLSAPYVPSVCQQVAVRTLQSAEESFSPVLEQFRARRRYAFDRLKAMGFAPSWPSGGFFCWLSVGELGMSGQVFAERLLKEQRVLVGPGIAFGPSGKNFVRVSFAAEDGRLREALGRLAAFVAGVKGQPIVQTATVSASLETPETPAVPKVERIPTFSRV